MYNSFLEICRLISREFSVIPLLYGSLGLERRLEINLNADDIDILIPEIYAHGEKWDNFRLFLENNGYMLIDEHEHTFVKDDINYSFASVEELENFANITEKDIPVTKDSDICYYLLALEQYLAVYTKSSADGYRINKKEKKDHEKIALIKNKLGK